MGNRSLRLVAAWAFGLAWTLPATAAELPRANKVIALVQSEGCDLAKLRSSMASASEALVSQRRTTRVAVDWPADPERNLDPMGRQSPFIAALEVSAAESALPAIGRDVEQRLGATCSTAVYLVHERRLVDRHRTWELGEPSPGTKTLTTQIRNEGLSLSEFNERWAGPHAQLALAWRKAAGVTEGHYVVVREQRDLGFGAG